MAYWKKSRIFFAGFVSENEYAGNLIFKEAIQREDGTLEFIAEKEMEQV